MSNDTTRQECIQHYQDMDDEVRALLLQAEPNSPHEKRLLDLSCKLTLALANLDHVCQLESTSCK